MTAILHNFGISDRLLSSTEAAYLAGFVDGEGCLTIGRAVRKSYRTGLWYFAVVTVSNTNLDALYRIATICGNGKIQLQDKRDTPSHKTLYRIVFGHGHIRHILPQIRPYLLIKGPQADILMEFLSLKKAGKHQGAEMAERFESLRSAVRGLNKRGIVDTTAETVEARPHASGWTHPRALRVVS